MSIIKSYKEGKTELNKLKFKPNMDQGEPPLVSKTIPSEKNLTPPITNNITRRIDDLSRISQLFKRKEGLGYLSNNTNLNLTVAQSYAVKGTIKDKFKALQSANVGAALNNTLGTLASTLAQVPLAGTGTHFVKGYLFGKPNTSFNKPTKTTYRIGDPGAVKVKYGVDPYYSTPTNSFAGLDKVNFLGPYSGTEQKKEADDYIKFFFEVVNPGEQNNTFLHFRAFLDSFSDSYSGNWNSFNYIGRGEPFHTYQSFNRTVDITFKSAVATKLELQPVYQKLVFLASTTAPRYSSNGNMQGTVVRMNLGDYISDTPGFITSVNYSWETRYPFEIGLGKKQDETEASNTDITLTQELPHVLNCSLSFTPIHTFTPQTGLYHYITNPLDTPSQFFPAPGQREQQEVTEEQQQNYNRLINQPGFDDLGSGF